jgi:hypothetical protein
MGRELADGEWPDAWCVEMFRRDEPWREDLARQGGRPPSRKYYIHAESAAAEVFSREQQGVFHCVLRPVFLGEPIPYTEFHLSEYCDAERCDECEGCGCVCHDDDEAASVPLTPNRSEES